MSHSLDSDLLDESLDLVQVSGSLLWTGVMNMRTLLLLKWHFVSFNSPKVLVHCNLMEMCNQFVL